MNIQEEVKRITVKREYIDDDESNDIDDLSKSESESQRRKSRRKKTRFTSFPKGVTSKSKKTKRKYRTKTNDDRPPRKYAKWLQCDQCRGHFDCQKYLKRHIAESHTFNCLVCNVNFCTKIEFLSHFSRVYCGDVQIQFNAKKDQAQSSQGYVSCLTSVCRAELNENPSEDSISKRLSDQLSAEPEPETEDRASLDGDYQQISDDDEDDADFSFSSGKDNPGAKREMGETSQSNTTGFVDDEILVFVQCELCFFPVAESRMSLHLAQMHNDNYIPAPPSPPKQRVGDLYCPPCDKSFMNDGKFLKHALTEHGCKSLEELMDKHAPKIKKPRAKNRLELVICDICGTSIQRRNLQPHLKRHSEQKPPAEIPKSICDLCGKIFPCNSDLLYHKDTEHDKIKQMCPVCGEFFQSRGTLSVHMQRFHNPVSSGVKCGECGKVFRLNRNLRYHQKRVHLKLAKHECSYCSKSFFCKETLLNHVNSHTGSGDKPWNCEECSASFTQRYRLNLHKKQVHGAIIPSHNAKYKGDISPNLMDLEQVELESDDNMSNDEEQGNSLNRADADSALSFIASAMPHFPSDYRNFIFKTKIE